MMANNELEQILEEIRRKNKEKKEEQAKQEQQNGENIPVEIVDTTPAAPEGESADDIFSDILKAIDRPATTPAPQEPQEPRVTYYSLDGKPIDEAPAEEAAEAEPPVQETPAVYAAEEAPAELPQQDSSLSDTWHVENEDGLTENAETVPEAVSEDNAPDTDAIFEEPAPSEDIPAEAPESMFTFVDDTAPQEPETAPAAAASVDVPLDPPKPKPDRGDAPIDEAALDFIAASDANGQAKEAQEDEAEDDGGKGGKAKKPLIIALVCLIIMAALVGVYFGFFYGKEKKPDVTESKPAASEISTLPPVTQEDGGIVNPLTGVAGYNEAAVGKRPVAVVVENEYSTASVRPQWGIEEADIIMEGETEYSTRMLFFWADYTNMPERIGPARSARPPFIRFSQLFDAIFIHAGLSHSKDNYVGADTVFSNENIDHINLLNFEENGTYFGRNYNRTSSVEHTGYLNGTNTAKLIENQKIRTDADANRYTLFEFNKEAQPTGTMDAKIVRFTWSNACPKHAKFTYIDNEGIYRTSDFDSRYGEADLQFETLILLLDQTEYITKQNYKTAGNSETYCNYKLSGGKGMIASEGKAMEITWDIEDDKLVLKDESGETVKLNPGKIYIGYGSSNHGGSYTAEAKQQTESD